MHPNRGIMNIDILSFMRLAYRIFDEVGGENRPVLEDTGKTLVKATALDKSFLSEFGVFSCYDAERNQTEFFKIGEGYIESLFVEAGHQASLKMKTPDIIFGALTKWEGTSHSMSCAMFSISNRKWLYKGLNNIEYNQGDDFEYYELQNGSKKGLADVNGALLIDVVMNKYQYCKGNFIVAIDDKWCLYNVAERRLVLPLADALYNISTTDFQGYIFVKTEKEKWRKRKVYRYLLDGKFISDYEYTYALRYRKQGDLWLAQVRRRDGKFGWIDTDGEFIADLPGEYDLAK